MEGSGKNRLEETLNYRGLPRMTEGTFLDCQGVVNGVSGSVEH